MKKETDILFPSSQKEEGRASANDRSFKKGLDYARRHNPPGKDFYELLKKTGGDDLKLSPCSPPNPFDGKGFYLLENAQPQ